MLAQHKPRVACQDFELTIEEAAAGDITPLGHAGEVAGIRYAHAWVELGDLLVVDLTMNGRPTMPRALYYRAGSLTEEHVRRYTVDEAVRLLHTSGHYGPWDGPALTIAA